MIMEVFFDFGLFELIGLVAVMVMGRDPRVRRRLRLALGRGRAKLGRCVRCMALTAVGLAASWGAFAAIGAQGSRIIRLPVLGVGLAFAGLGGLHLLAALYRMLTRLEDRFTTLAGGCNCGRRDRPRKGGLS